MANFAGFSDWVEIFIGGKQTDSAGKEHDGDAIIDTAVKNFDAVKHEPPVVIGHPKDDAPAYGWVESVKTDTRDGVKRMYAKFKQVVPEFADMVKSGRFKKRSASFYKDGRLRHVGWLGAMPPAVKGLADVAFSDNGSEINFDFEETQNPKQKEKRMKFSEFMEVLKFWKKTQGVEDPDMDLGDLAAAAGVGARRAVPDKAAASFTEADMEAAKTAAAKEAADAKEKAVRAEFAEAEAKRAKAATQAEIKSFIDAGMEKGTIAPAWKDAGLAQFMESLDAHAPVEFAEGKAKQTGLAWFKNFMEDIPKLVNFSEVATRDKDVKTGNAAAKLAKLVNEKCASNKDLSYGAAFAEVQREHPELAAEYQMEMTA